MEKRYKEPLVSIIVPVYNAENYLSKCIESIVNQRYSNIEIILVNDGSEDSSGKICDKYRQIDDRIRVFHQKNKGPSIARNFGIEVARGKYITFIDSDDYIENDMIYYMMNSINNEKIDLVLCSHIREQENEPLMACVSLDHLILVNKREDIHSIQESIWNIDGIKVDGNYHSLPLICCKLYKRAIIDNQNIRFDDRVSIGEDTLFAMQYLEYVDEMIVINAELYHQVIYSNSLSHGFDYDSARRWIENRKAFKEYIDSGKVSKRLLESYDYQVMYAIKTLLVNSYGHPCNKGKLDRKDLKDTLENENFKVSLNSIQLRKLSDMGSKIIYILCKMRLYRLLICLSKIRRKQLADNN